MDEHFDICDGKSHIFIFYFQLDGLIIKSKAIWRSKGSFSDKIIVFFIHGLNGDGVVSWEAQILGLERLDLIIVDIIEDDADFGLGVIRQDLEFFEE